MTTSSSQPPLSLSSLFPVFRHSPSCAFSGGEARPHRGSSEDRAGQRRRGARAGRGATAIGRPPLALTRRAAEDGRARKPCTLWERCSVSAFRDGLDIRSRRRTWEGPETAGGVRGASGLHICIRASRRRRIHTRLGRVGIASERGWRVVIDQSRNSWRTRELDGADWDQSVGPSLLCCTARTALWVRVRSLATPVAGALPSSLTVPD